MNLLEYLDTMPIWAELVIFGGIALMAWGLRYMLRRLSAFMDGFGRSGVVVAMAKLRMLIAHLPYAIFGWAYVRGYDWLWPVAIECWSWLMPTKEDSLEWPYANTRD